MPTVCTKCGLAIPSEKRKNIPMCQNCEHYLVAEYARNLYTKKNNKIGKDYRYAKGKVWEEAKYGEWLEMIKRVPVDYPRLTEAQWNNAVKYFDNKCALCQENVSSHRHYFITRQDGGMYCDWNIIPICEHCVSQSNKNPFRAMNRDTQRESTGKANKRKYGKGKLNKILDYLTPLLLKAVAKGNAQQVQNTGNKPVI